MKSPRTLLQTLPRLAGFLDWVWHVAIACFGPTLSNIAKDPVVRKVSCMLNAELSKRVFHRRMLDHVAIWVTDAPAVPPPNLITFAASIVFSSSISKSCLRRDGIFLVTGLIRPFCHSLRDLGVVNPADGWSSLETLHSRSTLASWMALL